MEFLYDTAGLNTGMGLDLGGMNTSVTDFAGGFSPGNFDSSYTDINNGFRGFGGGLVPEIAQGIQPSLPFGGYGQQGYTFGTSVLDPAAGPLVGGIAGGFLQDESGGFLGTLGNISRIASAILPGADSVARNIKGMPMRPDGYGTRFAGQAIGENKESSKSLQDRIAELDRKLETVLKDMEGVDTEEMESDEGGVIDSAPIRIEVEPPQETPDITPEPLDSSPMSQTDPQSIGIDRSGMTSSQDADFLRSRGYTVYTDANGEITGYETPQGMPFRVER